MFIAFNDLAICTSTNNCKSKIMMNSFTNNQQWSLESYTNGELFGINLDQNEKYLYVASRTSTESLFLSLNVAVNVNPILNWGLKFDDVPPASKNVWLTSDFNRQAMVFSHEISSPSST